MDDGAAAVEGTEACQGELAIEDGSLGNGFIDADGAQSHGAERVSDAQGVQVVGHHLTSMVSGGIAGAGAELGAAEDGGKSADVSTADVDLRQRPVHWNQMSRAQKNNWKRRYRK